MTETILAVALVMLFGSMFHLGKMRGRIQHMKEVEELLADWRSKDKEREKKHYTKSVKRQFNIYKASKIYTIFGFQAVIRCTGRTKVFMKS